MFETEKEISLRVKMKAHKWQEYKEEEEEEEENLAAQKGYIDVSKRDEKWSEN